MYKIILSICIFFVCKVCLSQYETPFFQRRVDSALKNEVSNYEELQKELGFSQQTIQQRRVLVLNDSVRVIQYRLGYQYELRVIFWTKNNEMELLSFGRQDFLVYFKKNYKLLNAVFTKRPSKRQQVLMLADIVLPEIYKVCIVQADSLLPVTLTFRNKSDSTKVAANGYNKKGVVGVNSLFLENRFRFYIRNRNLYLKDIGERKRCRREKITNYQYPVIDVVPFFIKMNK